MDRPQIVIDVAPPLLADLFDEPAMGRLTALGDVAHTEGSGRSRERAEILITGWGTPPLAVDRVGDRLRLVVHSAGTIRQLVPKSLIGHGLKVSHASAGMARSVAELAVYFTLALLRDLHSVDRAMFAQRSWPAASAFGLGRTVASTRVGVVGASKIGRLYLEQVRALGATVSVYDPYLSEQSARELGATRLGLDELLQTSQVIALHAPVTDETRQLLDARRLASIPDGAILINTARAAILDGAALERELTSGRLSAALDVFDDEPLPPGSGLWGLPNVILTPHIGAVTVDSRRAQGAIVVDEIERYVSGRPLAYEVHSDDYDLLA